MFKFGSIEDASKAYANGQFHKVEPPAPKSVEKKGELAGTKVGIKLPPLPEQAKEVVGTMIRKKKEAVPLPPIVPPPSPNYSRTPSSTGSFASSTKSTCSLTNPPVTRELFSPEYDMFRRIMALDGEKLKQAIATATSQQTQIQLLETYERYVRTFHNH